MCGIFGAIRFNGWFDRDDYAAFVGSTDIVSHRGPDARGHIAFSVEADRAAVSDRERFNVFLGHRRLSIIDLSAAGNQPLTDGRGRWITFNGEIFNYIELKHELGVTDAELLSRTDTEVILKVYERRGAAGFAAMNGMWAFALVDLPRKRVVLSRDRFAIEPLYFHQDRDGLYFASEIKQLLPVIKERGVNRARMATYLRQSLVDNTNETFFTNVYQAKAKHNITIDLLTGSIKESQYWDYDREPFVGGDREAEEQLRGLLRDAVRLRLRSDVPVGCLLSGGLDSSSVAVLAQDIAHEGVKCFAVVADDDRYSEERFVDILCSEAGIAADKLRLKSGESWDHLKNTIWHQDEPRTGLSVVAENLMLRLVRESSDIKVVLSGEGGDEVLCGYRKYFFFYLQQLFGERRFGTLLSNALLSLWYRTVLWQFSISDAKRYIAVLNRGRGRPWLERAMDDGGEVEPLWRSQSIRERQYLDLDVYSVPNLNHSDERNAAAYGLELRFPFYDYRVVNLCTRLPDFMKIRHGWTKYLLRRSIAALPPRIAWRRDKQGFITPEDRWMRVEFRERIEELFRTSRLHDEGLVDKGQMLEAYDSFLRGNWLISSRDIVRLMMAEVWYRVFFDGHGAAPSRRP